jgi:hypothetical protein
MSAMSTMSTMSIPAAASTHSFLPSGALAAKNPTCSRSVLLLLLLFPIRTSSTQPPASRVYWSFTLPQHHPSSSVYCLSFVFLRSCTLFAALLHSNFCRGLWRLDHSCPRRRNRPCEAHLSSVYTSTYPRIARPTSQWPPSLYSSSQCINMLPRLLPSHP